MPATVAAARMVEKRLHGLAVQGAARIIEVDDVGARAAGELELVHPRSSCAGVQRSRRRCMRCSVGLRVVAHQRGRAEPVALAQRADIEDSEPRPPSSMNAPI